MCKNENLFNKDLKIKFIKSYKIKSVSYYVIENLF